MDTPSACGDVASGERGRLRYRVRLEGGGESTFRDEC